MNFMQTMSNSKIPHKYSSVNSLLPASKKQKMSCCLLSWVYSKLLKSMAEIRKGNREQDALPGIPEQKRKAEGGI